MAVHIFPDRKYQIVFDFDDPAIQIVIRITIAQLASSSRFGANQTAFAKNIIDGRFWITLFEHAANRRKKIVNDNVTGLMHAGAWYVSLPSVSSLHPDAGLLECFQDLRCLARQRNFVPVLHCALRLTLCSPIDSVLAKLKPQYTLESQGSIDG